MLRLAFDRTHSYTTGGEGVTIPVKLRSGAQISYLTAKVDTGSSYCLFERLQGELLELEIEKGQRKFFSTVAGQVETFGHIIQIESLEVIVDSMAYFFANPSIIKNVLGRTGWLDRVRLGLVDYDRMLYLAPYDFESK